jgi:hypothetical protein
VPLIFSQLLVHACSHVILGNELWLNNRDLIQGIDDVGFSLPVLTLTLVLHESCIQESWRHFQGVLLLMEYSMSSKICLG